MRLDLLEELQAQDEITEPSTLLEGLHLFNNLESATSEYGPSFVSGTYTTTTGRINNGHNSGIGGEISTATSTVPTDNYSSTGFSVSIWFKPLVSVIKGILSIDYGIITNPFLYFQQYSGSIRFYFGGNYRLSVSAPNDDWYHLVYVYGSGRTKVYVNNVLSYDAAGGSTYGSSNTFLRVGGGYLGSADGVEDMVGIWNKELTVNEVDELYNDSIGNQYPFPSQSYASYIFYDSFRDTNGTALEDHTPEKGNGWTLVQGSAGSLSIQDNKVINSGIFLGPIYSTDVGTSNYIIRCRQKISNIYNSIAGINYRWAPGGTYGYYFSFQQRGFSGGGFYVWRFDGTPYSLLSSYAIGDDTSNWYDIRIEVNGTSHNIYINNILRFSFVDSLYTSNTGISTNLRYSGDSIEYLTVEPI